MIDSRNVALQEGRKRKNCIEMLPNKKDSRFP